MGIVAYVPILKTCWIKLMHLCLLQAKDSQQSNSYSPFCRNALVLYCDIFLLSSILSKFTRYRYCMLTNSNWWMDKILIILKMFASQFVQSCTSSLCSYCTRLMKWATLKNSIAGLIFIGFKHNKNGWQLNAKEFIEPCLWKLGMCNSTSNPTCSDLQLNFHSRSLVFWPMVKGNKDSGYEGALNALSEWQGRN